MLKPMAAPTTRAELFKLRLPMPPGVNNAYATVMGRRVLSREARDYKKAVKKIIQAAYPTLVFPKEPLEIKIQYFAPSVHNWDWDGRIKVLQDAIFEAQLEDAGGAGDSWIDKGSAEKAKLLHPCTDEAFCVVTIWTLASAADE